MKKKLFSIILIMMFVPVFAACGTMLAGTSEIEPESVTSLVESTEIEKITEVIQEKPNEEETIEEATEENASSNADITDNIDAVEGQNFCTVSIECGTILDNMGDLTAGKEMLIPSDGVILAPTKVCIDDCDNVFDVLVKVCKENKIHMEYSDTPIYDSAYIEGIHNLYEFDCGNLSGWEYSINGVFPNIGCSSTDVSDQDVIKWVYTCKLGRDIGDFVNGQ